MKAQLCANAAMDAVERVPPILYAEEDCQKFIEQTVKRAGGSIPDYAGSNDMYRNACNSWAIDPLEGAVLEPGMLLFIVEHDGGEPEKYKADGLGNASHVGWYTGGRYAVVHSSSTKGQVAASTLKNGWTHAGRAKGLEYAESQEDETVEKEPLKVVAPDGETVRMRVEPNDKALILANIRAGTYVVGIRRGQDGWYQIEYAGKVGWMMEKFLVADGAPATEPPRPPASPDSDDITITLSKSLAVALKTALDKVV